MAMETATTPSVPNTARSNNDDDARSSSIDSSSNSPQQMDESKDAEMKHPLECEPKPCSVDFDHGINNDESINQDECCESEAVSNVKETKDIVDAEVTAGSTGEQLEKSVECKSAQHENVIVEAVTAPLEDPIKAQAADAPQDSSQNQSSSDKNAPVGVYDSAPTINESISIEEGDFVAIELLESTNNDINIPEETRDTNDEQAILLDNDELHDTAAPAPPNTNNNNTTAAAAVPTPQNKIRRKLNHPLLTPLTKLPWDKLANTAAVSCDLLFNCKYSMRQVEDEVREEKKTIQYELHEDDDNNHQECDEDCGEDCNVQELGLHCCSMLDDSDEEGERRGGENKGEEPLKQQQKTSVEDRSDLLVKEEQQAKSWRGSNPSLDMVFYKQFLDE